MENQLLKFLLWVSKNILPAEVNTEQVKTIVGAKLMMDKRRTPPSWKKNQQQKQKNPYLIGMLVYGLMSVFIGVQAFIIPSILLVLCIYFSYILFLLSMILITDFSTVLLDTTDNHVLLPKPVQSKTIFVSRIIHITIYLSRYFLSLSLLPIIFYFICYGPLVGIVIVILTLLMILFTIAFTYLLYGIVLQFSTEQKLKDVIAFFQIIFTIAISISFQILPRILNVDDNFIFKPGKFLYFLPPGWMAYAAESIAQRNFDMIHLLMLTAAFLIPVIVFYIIIRFIAPIFSHKLSVLGSQDSGGIKTIENQNSHTSIIKRKRFADWILLSNYEKAGYEIVQKVTARDKAFKIAFYPSVGYLLVYIFIIFFRSKQTLAVFWSSLPETNNYFWLIYMPIFICLTALGLIPYSENSAAAWLYQSTPISKPGEIINGGLKAIFLKFFLPIYFILAALGISVWGSKVIPAFLVGFFANIFILYCVALLSPFILPFSIKASVRQQGGKFIKTMLQFIIIGAFVGLQYFLQNWWFALLALGFVAVGGIYLAQKYLQNISWKKIKI